MDNITSTRIQQKVNNGLTCVATHATVVVLVLLDILVITVLLLTDLCLQQDSTAADQCTNGAVCGNKHERMRQAQFIIGIIQLTVLSAFVFEMIIRFLANIPGIIHDKWQVFDCLVVLVAFALYISLEVNFQRLTAAYSTAYVISLRLWRIGRIYYDIQHKAGKHAESLMHVHFRTATAYEDQLKKAQLKTAVQKRHIERLQQAVLCLKSVVYSSLALSAIRTRSLPAVSQGHTVADLNNETSRKNFNLDPRVQAMESYLQSLLNEDQNSSYFNEAFIGDGPTEEEFHGCPSTSAQAQIQSDNVPSTSVLLSVLSQMCTDDDKQAIEQLSQVPFPFDHTRSYLSHDGIPMTDL